MPQFNVAPRLRPDAGGLRGLHSVKLLLEEQLAVVTADPVFAEYGVKRVW